MATFSMNRERLSLLAACLNVGMDTDTMQEFSGATSDDLEAIGALALELDAIACSNGTAEITVMRD